MKSIPFICMSTLALVSCSEPAEVTENSAAVSVTAPATVAEILDADMRNPELTAALNQRLNSLTDAATRADELAEAGFVEADAGPDCTRKVYLGEERTRLGQDDTLTIGITSCATPDGVQQEMNVFFGDSGG